MDGANTANGLPDGDHVNNANMNDPAGRHPAADADVPVPANDGQVIAGNSGDEADIVYHEYTHGLSNRLVVDANGVSDAERAPGRRRWARPGATGTRWTTWSTRAWRRTPRPTATCGSASTCWPAAPSAAQPLDCAVGSTAAACAGTPAPARAATPTATTAKITPVAPEVHADGEIWAQTLWDLRKAHRQQEGRSRWSPGRWSCPRPTRPSWTCATRSCRPTWWSTAASSRRTIWKVFAARGMGYFAGAVSGSDAAPVEDFSVPPPAEHPARLADRHRSPTGTPARRCRCARSASAGTPPASPVTTWPPRPRDGTYTITGIIPGTYPKVFARGAGYDAQITDRLDQLGRHHAGLAGAAGLGGVRRRRHRGLGHRTGLHRRTAVARSSCSTSRSRPAGARMSRRPARTSWSSCRPR